MKKLAVFMLLLLCAATTIYAQGRRGALNVRLSDNYPITLAIDGRYYDKYGPELTIGNLPAGEHFLKIYTYTAYNDGKARAHLVYSDYVRIKRHTLTALVMDAHSGEVSITRSDMDEEDNDYEDGDAYNYRGNDNLYDDNTTAKTSDVHNYTGLTVIEAPKDKNIYADDMSKWPLSSMSDDEVKRLSVKVKNRIDDSGKLKEIEDALEKKSITVDQLVTMVKWLNFDDSKVKLAKWAYSHTTDKQHYDEVSKQLTYANSKNELSIFIWNGGQ